MPAVHQRRYAQGRGPSGVDDEDSTATGASRGDEASAAAREVCRPVLEAYRPVREGSRRMGVAFRPVPEAYRLDLEAFRTAFLDLVLRPPMSNSPRPEPQSSTRRSQSDD